jgi:hypothetical protein
MMKDDELKTKVTLLVKLGAASRRSGGSKFFDRKLGGGGGEGGSVRSYEEKPHVAAATGK